MPLINQRELDRLSASKFIESHPDDYLDAVIESVSVKVEAFCFDTSFYPIDVTEEVTPRLDKGTLVFNLSRHPLLNFSGASVQWDYPTNPANYPLDITGLRYVQRGHTIYLPPASHINYQTIPPGEYYTARLFISYRAGYETVPLTVKRATALLCKEQILAEGALSDPANAHRIMASSPLQSFRAGYYSETFQAVAGGGSSAVDKLGQGTPLSVEAMRLLNMFRGARLVIT